MDSIDANEVYTYIVDRNDFILSVSENWRSFAEENNAAQSCFPENIIGSSLWDHMHDSETRHLYKIILQKVRRHQRQATFSFRCDSPKVRRFLELSVLLINNGSVEFKSRILRTEVREVVELLDFEQERSEELIKICSMCKKIAITETQWEDVEIALQKLKLFERDILPQITHGVCRSCYEAALTELDRLH